MALTSSRSSQVFCKLSLKQPSHTRLEFEYATPSFGIAIQGPRMARDREHPLFFTATRFGLPFLPPISNGARPLRFIFFIFGLGFSDSTDERLK
jgi:hypothetical protein